MPGTNLTRAEAQARAELLEVHSYDVRLDLSGGPLTFGSTTVVRFGCRRPGESTFADLVGASIASLSLNGVALDPEQVYAESRLRLDDLAVENVLEVVADCPYSRTGEGLHRFVDPVDDRVYLYSQFEVPDARRVFTTFEQPDLKATFDFTVVAPDHWTVVSNATTPEPVAGDVTSTAVWRFPTTTRLSTYVTAVVAGEYHAVHHTYRGAHGEIPLGHYCRRSMVPHLDVDALVEITRRGFAFFEDAFGYPYPFGGYDQVYVPEFNAGAMENAGCVVLRDEYLPRDHQVASFYEQRANTVLHEMAHMWFGDLVTMSWWDDLWLNESFAEWASHHAASRAITEFADIWTGFCNHRKNWAYRQDQLPTTHPVAADNHDLAAVEVNFDGITYAKGASALKQLVAWVGERAFLDGLGIYFHRHAFGNSEFTDLLGALEETSGRDLTSWAQEWLKTSGVTTLSAEVEAVDGELTSVTVVQTAAGENDTEAGDADVAGRTDAGTLRRHRLGIGLFDLAADGRLRLRSELEVDVQGARTEVPELAGVARPDLLLLNHGDLTYAKIRLDERSWATVLGSLDALEDPLARALCWGMAWDMTRDAELDPAEFADLVLRCLGSETDGTAVRQLPAYVELALDQFTPSARRPELRRTWEDGVRALLERAEPGSDTQLSLLRSFAGSVGKRIPPASYGGAGRSEAARSLLSDLLEGAAALPGVEVDAGLRWLLLTSLAAAGDVDRERIEAEQRLDGTISGQERASAALAVLPSPQAKDDAWRAVTERDDVANETHRSIAYVFDVAGQADVLAPYLERFLDVAETVWDERGVAVASTTLEYLFPRALTSGDTLERVSAWLSTSKAPEPAKKFVREIEADLRRAVRAQHRSEQSP